MTAIAFPGVIRQGTLGRMWFYRLYRAIRLRGCMHHDCLFETRTAANLSAHYSIDHAGEPVKRHEQ